MALSNATELADWGSGIGTGPLQIDNVNKRIGIGTTAPLALTDIFNQTGVTTTLLVRQVGDYDILRLEDEATPDITAAVVVKADGKVGIGTDDPQSKLQLVNPASNPKIRFDRADNFRNNWIGLDSADDFVIAADESDEGGASSIRFRIDASEKARLTSTGRLGIGTDSPSHSLDVIGNTQLYGTLIVGDNTDVSPSSSGTGQFRIDCLGYTGYIAADGTAMYVGHNAGSRDLIFQTDETDRVTIDSSGKVGIGTDDPQTLLHVDGTSNSDARITISRTGYLRNNWIGLEDDADNLAISVDEANAGADSSIRFRTDGTERVRIIGSSGYVGLGTEGNSSPTAALSIKQGAAGQHFLDVMGTATKQFGFYYDQGSWDEGIFRIDEFDVSGNATSRLSIYGKKIGIGTDLPNQDLEIVDTVPHVSLWDEDHNYRTSWWQSGNATVFEFDRDSTGGSPYFKIMSMGGEVIRIEDGGEVGINTSNPDKLLTISPDGGGTDVDCFKIKTQSGAFNIRVADTDATNPTWYLRSFGSEPLGFMQGTTLRGLFNEIGNFCVGTGAANDYSIDDDTNAKLQLTSTATPKMLLIRDDTSVVLDNWLGIIDFMSRDGGPARAARIGAIATGTHATDDNPTALVFQVCADGAGASAEAWRILDNSNFKPATDGVGIDFSKSQGGNATSSVLDDYEQGTFTPTFGGSSGDPTCTYDNQHGDYIKIGNQVTCMIRMRTDSVSGGSGNLRIEGLPYASWNNDNQGGGHIAYSAAWLGDKAPGTILMANNSTLGTLYHRKDGDEDYGAMTISDLNTGGNDNDIRMVWTYFTAAS